MWKQLNHWDSVSVGDKIRFRGTYPGNPEDAYTVVQTEAHYFQILPAVEKAADEMRRKVVKYFEIGTYLKVEVWASN
ncbi:MAG: hypothetical protein ACM3VS_16455 [Candidatus Dadabacteria bacterium]